MLNRGRSWITWTHTLTRLIKEARGGGGKPSREPPPVGLESGVTHAFWRIREPAECSTREGDVLLCHSALRAAKAQGYNELLHPSDWYPPTRPTSESQTHSRPRPRPPTLPIRRMPGGKRGLVAPQNTFLENIVRRSSGKSVSYAWQSFGLFGCLLPLR